MDDLTRLRVDQVGSLVAPPGLRTDRDAAIRAAIRRQEEIGLPVVSDGELRRQNFQESFAAAVSGFDAPTGTLSAASLALNATPFARNEQNFAAAGPAIVTRRRVTERLKLVKNVALAEYRFAVGVATRPVKVTLLSPDRIAQRFAWEESRAVYRDMDAFLADVIAIERQMVSELVAAGCRYIQIDAPGYTAYVDQVSLERMKARGEDPDANLVRSIAADNAVIEGFAGVTFGIHFCRGNPRTRDPETGKIVAQWHREGNYDPIAERLFAGLRHERLLLEYDSERAGTFAPLRYVPRGKIAVLGLVTTKSADLESEDFLRRRIAEASRFLPLDQLALSPQCGFGGGDPLHPQLSEDEQWAKFERIVTTARAVWG
jgi:5-methyltetrahydropteroyltriglutamate--homocysteine methyltransferase